jgi:predicted amino acid dehydrogenase
MEMFTSKIRLIARVIIDACKPAAKKIARAAAIGAAVAALTALAAEAPVIGAHFGLPAIATGQVVAIVLMARDALKAREGN